MLGNSITVCIAAGSASVISRAIGTNRTEIQRKIIPNMIAFVPYKFGSAHYPRVDLYENLVSLLGTTGELLTYGVNSFRVYATGIIFNVYGLSK